MRLIWIALLGLGFVGTLAHAETLPAAGLDARVEQLSSKDPSVRSGAVRWLGDHKVGDPVIIEKLVAMLNDRSVAEERPIPIPAPHTLVAHVASDSLVQIGEPAILPVANALGGFRDEGSLRVALSTLKRLGHRAGPATTEVRDTLDAPSPVIRVAGVHTLAAIEADSPALVATLRGMLQDSSPDVRAAAAQEIGATGEAGSPAVDEIIAMLDDPSMRWRPFTPDMVGKSPVRIDAIHALRQIGPSTKSAGERLRRIMADDPNDTARIAAAHALVRIENDREAFSVLVGVLNDEAERPGVLIDALESMKELGQDAAPALHELLLVTENDEPWVRVAAIDALAVVDATRSEKRLVELTNDPNEMVRETALTALGHVSSPTDASIRALSNALDDSETLWAREYAAKSLGELGVHAALALPKLRRLLTSQDLADSERMAIERAIEAIVASGNGS